MRIQAFDPKFMKVGVLTAAIQELTPREVRDADPDRADRGMDRLRARSSAPTASSSRRRSTRRRPTCRPRRCSTRSPTRSTCASRSTRIARSACTRRWRPRGSGISDVGYFDNMLHDDPAIRQKKLDFMRRIFDAAVAAGRQCGVRVRRAQPAAQHGPEPDRLRGDVRPAAERGQGPRACNIGSSSARCPAGRPATTCTTTSRTRRGRGSRCTGSARSTRSATSSASTTIRRTPS